MFEFGGWKWKRRSDEDGWNCEDAPDQEEGDRSRFGAVDDEDGTKRNWGRERFAGAIIENMVGAGSGRKKIKVRSCTQRPEWATDRCGRGEE